MGTFDKFMDFYHNHPTGANKFFDDAYSKMGDYDTNFGLQSDMIDHAAKHVGKFVLNNPEHTHEEVYKELKQKKLDLEREAFNESGSHLNGAPQFHSMFLPEDHDTSDMGVNVDSLKMKQKQNTEQNNKRVLQQFGITPKPKTEGNNIINAKDRFRMKKSDVVAMIVKSFNQMPASVDIDGSMLLKCLKEKGDELSKSDIDEISSQLVDIQSRIKQKEEKASQKQKQIEHNSRVMEKYKNFDETTKRIDALEQQIKDLHSHIFGKNT